MSVAQAHGQRLRLLLLTDTSILSAGGSERFLRNLAARLPMDRYHITVVQLTESTHAWTDSSLPDHFQHVKIHSLPTAAAYGLSGLLALRRLRRMVKSDHFDIVQSQHEKSDLFNALLPRTPGTLYISNRRDMGFNKSSRLTLLFRFLNHRFDCIIAPAQPILGDLFLKEKIAARKMLWIPNGVDSHRFRPQAPAERSTTRKALGLSEENVAIGCVASLTPVKCHDHLLEAFAQVHQQLPHARLLLIGDGSLRQGIEAQIERLGLNGSVVLLGNRPDVEKVLPALDMVVLASSTEGMSNALLEAMACGLPIVATAIGGNLQLVQPDVTGLLVPVGKPTALAGALLALGKASHTRARMGAAARSRIERDFSLDSMVRNFDRLYHRLLVS